MLQRELDSFGSTLYASLEGEICVKPHCKIKGKSISTPPIQKAKTCNWTACTGKFPELTTVTSDIKDAVIKHMSVWLQAHQRGHQLRPLAIMGSLNELQTCTMCFVRGDEHQWLVKDDVSCLYTGRGPFSQASCWLPVLNRILFGLFFLSFSWTFLLPSREKNPPSWN